MYLQCQAEQPQSACGCKEEDQSATAAVNMRSTSGEVSCSPPAASPGQPAAFTVPLPAAIYVVYEDRQTLAAGVILVTAGLCSVVITSIGVGLYNIFTFLAHGIWFGIVVSSVAHD